MKAKKYQRFPHRDIFNKIRKNQVEKIKQKRKKNLTKRLWKNKEISVENLQKDHQ